MFVPVGTISSAATTSIWVESLCRRSETGCLYIRWIYARLCSRKLCWTWELRREKFCGMGPVQDITVIILCVLFYFILFIWIFFFNLGEMASIFWKRLEALFIFEIFCFCFPRMKVNTTPFPLFFTVKIMYHILPYEVSQLTRPKAGKCCLGGGGFWSGGSDQKKLMIFLTEILAQLFASLTKTFFKMRLKDKPTQQRKEKKRKKKIWTKRFVNTIFSIKGSKNGPPEVLRSSSSLALAEDTPQFLRKPYTSAPSQKLF